MKYKLRTVVYDLDQNNNSMREENTYEALLKYAYISSRTKNYSSDNVVNVFELTKEPLPGVKKFIELQNGKSMVKVMINNDDGTKSLNPLLSVETDSTVWGVIRVIEEDREAGYLKVERDRLPANNPLNLPDYVPLDAFDSSGDAQSYKFFAANDTSTRPLKGTVGKTVAEKTNRAGMSLIGGLALAGFLNARKGNSIPRNNLGTEGFSPDSPYVSRHYNEREDGASQRSLDVAGVSETLESSLSFEQKRFNIFGDTSL